MVDVQKVNNEGCSPDQINEVIIADNSTEKKNPDILEPTEFNGEVIKIITEPKQTNADKTIPEDEKENLIPQSSKEENKTNQGTGK